MTHTMAHTMAHTMRRRVGVDINLDNLVTNYRSARRCSPNSRVFSVLKANAYGHGMTTCAQALASIEGTERCDAFAVVFPGEAMVLREAGIDLPILVLQGPMNNEEVNLLSSLDAWAVVHDHTQLQLLESSTISKPLTIWLKADTGMGRLGFNASELASVAHKLDALASVNIVGLLSHFASADNPGNAHTAGQIQDFSSLLDALADTGMTGLQYSLSNSAGVMAWSDTISNSLCAFRQGWVRPGIMLYGANPMVKGHEGHGSVILKPVMNVTAPIVALKQMRCGDGIGYDQTWQCPEDMLVGFAAIGYGDGLPRVLDENATVLLCNHAVPIVGRVSMDSIALDLRLFDRKDSSSVPRSPGSKVPRVGDRIVVWGDGAPVEELARCAGTMSYELLCGIRSALPVA